MLGTLIITAAFTSGDTVDYSITKSVYDGLQRTDLTLDRRGFPTAGQGGPPALRAQATRALLPADALPTLEAAFATDPDIAGFLPFCRSRSRRSTRGRAADRRSCFRIDLNQLARLGGLRPVDGVVDLARLNDGEALISCSAAAWPDAAPATR
ncbi:MAG: hypothetical protein U0531_19440 [Dehalococcoidia bacterium]